jgi:hypothetical protein
MRSFDDTITGRRRRPGTLNIEIIPVPPPGTASNAHNILRKGDRRSSAADACPRRDASTEQSPEPTPEEQALLRELKETHYQKWLESPIPALGGKTPRAAARSAKGRRDLDLLLRDIENRENRLPAETRFDMSRLRRALGLSREGRALRLARRRVAPLAAAAVPVESAGTEQPARLALLFLRLGATAFGGPAAHVAMMEDEVVRRRGWMTREELLDLLSAANLIPGPNSTELAIHIGYRRKGWPGLIVAGACFILPAALIVTFIAWLYVRYAKLPQAEAALYGIAGDPRDHRHALWRLGGRRQSRRHDRRAVTHSSPHSSAYDDRRSGSAR